MSEEELKWHEEQELLMNSNGTKPNALYGMKESLESQGYKVSTVYRATASFAAIRIEPKTLKRDIERV